MTHGLPLATRVRAWLKEAAVAPPDGRADDEAARASTDGELGAVRTVTPSERPPTDGMEQARVRTEVLRRLVGDDSPEDEVQRVGRFQLLRKLGQGGMGVVYAAYDAELDRRVAIKLIRSDGRRQNQDRMRREAQALAKLAHPNVVAVFDVGSHDDQLFIAMEYVEGVTLRRWCEADDRRVREIVSMYAQAAQGLAAAHAAGLVHRDFKPDNVLVGDDARARVLDFGLVRRHDEVEPEEHEPKPTHATLDRALTETGTLMGTPAYMAPEQFLGDAVDARSDQFSFCVALHEAVYGGRPFAGASPMALAHNVTAGKRAPTPRRRDVPAWLEAVLARGLALAPADRFATMDELLLELRQAARRTTLRRVGVALGGMAVVGVGVLGVQHWEERQRIAACDVEGATIAEVWTASQRETVRTTLTNTGSPIAEDVVARVLPRMTEHAAQWQEAATEACLQGTVERTLSEEQLEGARWCLEENQQRFAALAEGMAGATEPADATMAVSAATSLPHPDRCTDPRWLERVQLPPSEDLASVSELRRMLANADASSIFGDYDGSAELSRTVLDGAREIGWAPLIVDASLRSSFNLAQRGRALEAEPIVRDAFLEALRAQAPEAAMDAAFEMAAVVGIELGRDEEGRHWLDVAEALGAALPDPQGRVEASLHQARGDLAEKRRDNGEAAEHYRRAIPLLSEALGPNHVEVIHLRAGLGKLAINSRNYEEAEALVREVMPLATEQLGENHPTSLGLVVDLAAIVAEGGDLERARTLTLRAAEGLGLALGPKHPAVANAILNLATLDAMLGDAEQAESRAREGLDLVEQALGPDHPLAAHALGVIVEALMAQGKFEAALPFAERSVSLKEKAHPDGHPELVLALGMLGSLHLQLGDEKQSREVLERAVAMAEALLGPDHIDVAMMLASLGETVLAEGDAEEALNLARRAITIYDDTGQRPWLAASARFLLAQALRASGKPAEARAAAERALETSQQPQERERIEAWLASDG